jgi:threonine aldolase
MKFFSDNAATVHPAVWAAMHQADRPDAGYDGDSLSRRLGDAFGALFGCPTTVLWTATGTAANCLALATMVTPYGGVVCHREAHIEADEGGAPGFFTHGAKLILAEGDGAKLTPAAIEAVLAPIRDDVHQVQAQVLSITQATEYGRVYTPAEVRALGELARRRGLRFHMDGARFANAVARLGCSPAELTVQAGVEALSFGCVKNGGMSAEAIVFFDPALAETARRARKRSGHLQSKGRYLAAQILALLDNDLWLANGRAANDAAAELAVAAGDRLIQPVEANEVFLVLSPAEAAALRQAGFDFYDWNAPAGAPGAARLVTAWSSDPGEVAALARAIAAL